MKNKLLSLVLMMVIFSSSTFAIGIPVIDVSAIAAEVLNFTQEATKWKKYIDNFTKLKDDFEDRFNKFKRVMSGFDIEDIEELLEMYEDLEDMYKKSPYLKDELGLDVWHDVYLDKISIKQKYPDIDNFDYIKQNAYYQANSEFRQMQDKRIEVKKEVIEDIDNHNKFLADFRDMQNKRSETMTKIRNQMKEIGVDKTSDDPADTAKIIALWSEMNFESLSQNYQLLTMMRIYFEDMVKMRVRAMEQGQDFMKSIRGEKDAVKKLMGEE